MLSIITSYLAQTGECALPYLGLFSTQYNPAQNNIEKKQMLPPDEEVIFTEGIVSVTPGLLKYAARKKNMTEEEVAVEIEKFCRSLKEEVNSGEILHFETVGTLYKNEAGAIFFSRETNQYINAPLMAERVIQQNTDLTALADEGQTNAAEAYNNHFDYTLANQKSWMVWALALFLLALFLFAYSFYHKRFSPSSIGNGIHLNIKNAEQTHVELSP